MIFFGDNKSLKKISTAQGRKSIGMINGDIFEVANRSKECLHPRGRQKRLHSQ